MPTFSKTSWGKLMTCHPDLQCLFDKVVLDFDCTVLEGHRNEADQNAAYERGNSTLRFPKGKHNAIPSMAVDVAPFPIDWKNTSRFYWFAGYVLGVADALYRDGKMTHRIRWGGDWDRDYDITDEKGLKDLVHYELIKVKK